MTLLRITRFIGMKDLQTAACSCYAGCRLIQHQKKGCPSFWRDSPLTVSSLCFDRKIEHSYCVLVKKHISCLIGDIKSALYEINTILHPVIEYRE